MGYAIVQGNTVEPLKFLMVSAADHITGLTGLAPTVTINKGGALGFAVPAGAVVEMANGWYAVLPNATDASEVGPLVLHATAPGADPCDDTYDVKPVAFPPPVAPPVTPAPGRPGGDATFESVWRKVRLYIPGAPVYLVRAWVEDAYKTLCDQRGWGWLIRPVQVTWNDARADLDVTVTRGSVTVTSAAAFLAADAGRQFRVGSFPIYTIVDVPDASTITLDQPYYGGPSGAVTADILDVYATLPIGFGAFTVLVDPTYQRFVPWWGTQEELALLDPTRQSTAGTPRLLVAKGPSQYLPTWGQAQYEFWPIPTAAGAFQGYQRQRPTNLADDAIFQGVLAERSDVLETGALAAAAKWPGTADVPNPYFNLALARQLQDEFEDLATQLDLRDDDQYQQSWSTIPWHQWQGYLWSYDTHLLQATDATLGAYWGGGSYYG